MGLKVNLRILNHNIRLKSNLRNKVLWPHFRSPEKAVGRRTTFKFHVFFSQGKIKSPSHFTYWCFFFTGRYDNQRLYRIFDNVFVGDRYIHLSNRYNICLATQSSIDKLDSLSEVAQHWSGPISLAVYVADDDEFSLLQGQFQSE